VQFASFSHVILKKPNYTPQGYKIGLQIIGMLATAFAFGLMSS